MTSLSAPPASIGKRTAPPPTVNCDALRCPRGEEERRGRADVRADDVGSSQAPLVDQTARNAPEVSGAISSGRPSEWPKPGRSMATPVANPEVGTDRRRRFGAHLTVLHVPLIRARGWGPAGQHGRAALPPTSHVHVICWQVPACANTRSRKNGIETHSQPPPFAARRSPTRSSICLPGCDARSDGAVPRRRQRGRVQVEAQLRIDDPESSVDGNDVKARRARRPREAIDDPDLSLSFNTQG